MSHYHALPLNIDKSTRILLFDGVCNLCNRWVQFVLASDPAGQLKLASVQSPAGQALLAWCGLPVDQFDTMVFIENGKAYTKSTAFLRAVRYLRWPWPALSLGIVVPALLRDRLYDLVAGNRYLLFGKRETCLLPTPQTARRFL